MNEACAPLGRPRRSRPLVAFALLLALAASSAPSSTPVLAQPLPTPTDPLAPLVQQIDPYHFQLPREEVMLLVYDHPELVTFMPEVAVVTSGADRRTIALRVVDLQRTPWLGTLGLLRGDLIRVVNGVPVREPADVAPLFFALRDGVSVEIALTRLGIERTLVWEMVDLEME